MAEDAPRPRCASGSGTSSSTSTRTPTRARSRCCGRWPGTGATSTVVGDPHQAIYAFRGAEVRGILEFPTDVPPRRRPRRPTSSCCGTTRRFGPPLLRARPAGRRPAAAAGRPGRRPRGRPSAAPGRPPSPAPGRVEVLTFDTDRAEAEHLADLLRRAHLEDGVAWSDMAVLVRSGRATIPPLRRALLAAGVPVEVAATRRRWSGSPPSGRCSTRCGPSLDLDEPDPRATSTSTRAAPTGCCSRRSAGLDAADVRRAGPAAAPREKARAAEEDRPRARPPSCCARRSSTPGACGVVTDHAEPAVRKARGRSPRCCAGAGPASRPRRPPRTCSGRLWSGTDWPRPAASPRHAGRGRRRAPRTATSTPCARSSTTAARAEERSAGTPVSRDLPGHPDRAADPRRHARRAGIRGEAVRLLTAHRAKGLEWRLVVVAHVQEEGWPDLRRRVDAAAGRPARAADGLVPPTTTRELLADERRLFYVACTRARERLVVTAVASTDDEGEQPSRFLDELGVGASTARDGRPRAAVADRAGGRAAAYRRRRPRARAAARSAAARRLARLAREHRRAAGCGSRPPTPRPGGGPAAATVGDEPLRAAGRAGPALRQRPHQPAAVPGAVVPGARGGRRAGVDPVAGLRQHRPRARRPGRPRPSSPPTPPTWTT